MGCAHAQDSIEQPKYDVIKQSDGVELRNYAPYLAAEVTIEAGSSDEASNKGFRQLAGYIFGGNQRADKIAMTAPVTTQAKSASTTIAMTAPVTTSKNEDGAYTIQFSMPSKWTMDTLPIPDNDKIELTEIPAEQRVAYRYIGTRSEALIKEAAAKIEDFRKAEDLEAASSLIVAGYDGPSVPQAQRRWEVMQIVKRSVQ
ncbi:SOUL family heme-binding protein [Parasphingorhabdus halotolerans]|uniref:Heme-binding protein n=1 Tax=Parasphingorhabdus halotolerans TaxID=2725558 RepID=A0A6H2DM96_9SPHN|nr:heme-binding protein [Parasphingorhabdus halotolerans]QJB69474.1 heme-binding protein [Parasphingorhabdus halotolerans]